MFRAMDEDPFFEGFRDYHRQVDEMVQRPFAGMGMIEGGRQQHDRGRDRPRDSQAVDLFGGFGFRGGFGNVFENMNKHMRDMEKAFSQSMENGQGQSYCQSSFMSYKKNGDGPPKVFQASSSTRQGPGGVRETRKALRDSERELEKMAIGHHIRDRAHEVERRRNTRTGTQEEFQNLTNLEDKDLESFDREWQDKTRDAFRGLDYSRRPGGRQDNQRSLPDSRSRRRTEQLALPDSRTEHWGKTRDERDRS